MGIEEFRDIIIVVFGAVTVLFGLIVLAFALYLYLLYRRTRGAIADLRHTEVDPIVAQVRGFVAESRATGTFVNDHGVRPVVTAWRIFRRARRAAGIAGSLRLIVSSLLLLARARSVVTSVRDIRTKT